MMASVDGIAELSAAKYGIKNRTTAPELALLVAVSVGN
jgi:hypothetical protein